MMLYFDSLDTYASPESQLSAQGLEGRRLWAKYNCQSCHQLFKLGGYLGPELTHSLLQPGKSEEYAIAFMLSGSANMPALGLSTEEAEAIARYLAEVARAAAILRELNPPYANFP